MLYGQFLQFKKTGVIVGVELRKIRDQYCEWFNANPINMIQYDLMHNMADIWYWNK